jgi:mRNA interferase MazF
VKRGDIVIATGPGFGGKPRPNLVVQANNYLSLSTLILLPITSDLSNPPSLLRVRIEPDEANGLQKVSEVMADIPFTTRPDKVHKPAGTLSTEDMDRVEDAILLVLGFAG